MNRENFVLTKIKLVKERGVIRGVELSYKERVVDETGKIEEKNLNMSNPAYPAEDMLNLFKELTPMVAEVWRFSEINELFADLKPSTEQVETFLLGWKKIVEENMSVTGITVSGEDSKRGAVITGKFMSEMNIPLVMNTPRILFGSDTYSFSDDLPEVWEKIETEAHAYIYLNKKSEPELFNGVSENATADGND